MKKTVKTSRVAGQLEKMYRLLNARFFNGELPEVVISLKKTVGAYRANNWHNSGTKLAWFCSFSVNTDVLN